MIRALTFIAIAALLCSCTREMTLPDAYAWLRDPENGLTDTMVIRNYVIRCTMVPAAFRRARLAATNYNEHHTTNAGGVPPGTNAAADAVVLSLEISRRDGGMMGDILFDDMTSVQSYTERLAGLSFRLHEDMTLETPGGTYAGADTFMEQTTGLGQRRVITITMAADENAIAAADEARLTWTDRYFGAGRIQFEFRPRSLRTLPDIRI